MKKEENLEDESLLSIQELNNKILKEITKIHNKSENLAIMLSYTELKNQMESIYKHITDVNNALIKDKMNNKEN